jgi:hypothetical protein
MEMIDRLAAVSAIVDDDAVAAAQVQLFGQVADHQQQVRQQVGILIADRLERGDLFFGNDEDVRGCLRRHVVEGEAAIVFVDDFGRNFFVDDPLEDCCHGEMLRGFEW